MDTLISALYSRNFKKADQAADKIFLSLQDEVKREFDDALAEKIKAKKAEGNIQQVEAKPVTLDDVTRKFPAVMSKLLKKVGSADYFQLLLATSLWEDRGVDIYSTATGDLHVKGIHVAAVQTSLLNQLRTLISNAAREEASLINLFKKVAPKDYLALRKIFADSSSNDFPERDLLLRHVDALIQDAVIKVTAISKFYIKKEQTKKHTPKLDDKIAKMQKIAETAQGELPAHLRFAKFQAAYFDPANKSIRKSRDSTLMMWSKAIITFLSGGIAALIGIWKVEGNTAMNNMGEVLQKPSVEAIKPRRVK